MQKWLEHAHLSTTAIYAAAVGAEEHQIMEKCGARKAALLRHRSVSGTNLEYSAINAEKSTNQKAIDLFLMLSSIVPRDILQMGDEMANVYGSPKKAGTRSRLFQIGVEILEREGWTVERIPGIGKSSVRRITKGGKSRTVSIRTTQDTAIAFPRNKDDSGWVTLSDVDAVVAVSVDDADDPKFALVHMIDGDEMRDRFDRAYAARTGAGHSIPLGRGVWLQLYIPDATDPPAHVGCGAGLDNAPLARIPLKLEDGDADAIPEPAEANDDDKPLTIVEAKRRLALSLGVDPSNIRITVEA